ncbi:MAG: nicotinate phosphoribosyltransferase [Spirochaetales bacterium]|nr:nicotinate phosphoribosyltransferase [Spirochaetales bacterium]
MYESLLLTDFYELTMAQGFYLGQKNPQVVFDMFFRRSPFGSGYAVFAGLEDLLARLGTLRFNPEDLAYLDSRGIFQREFLDYLSTYHFSGDLYSFDEGSLVFPGEPLIRVHSSLIEAQILESLLLNIINFQTLIATKAARLYTVCNGGRIMEFGLRRAQGIDGALSASRAAYIGGCVSTSNSLAGKNYGIPLSGTMAHSWIMAFDSELEAFRAFAAAYPDNAILLIDTYDTLGSGIQNAITVGLEQRAAGKKIGVRLDSGDLQYLSARVREKLDRAGLSDAVICVSNDLNEEIVQQLVLSRSPIDFWGIGTQLVTGGSDSSLAGVYKLAARQTDQGMQPTIKVSNNPEKITNPGIKQVYRFYDENRSPQADLICLAGEEVLPGRSYRFNHPMFRFKHFILEGCAALPQLKLRVKRGERIQEPEALPEIRGRALEQLAALDGSHKRLLNPHTYKISLSDTLRDLKNDLLDRQPG